MPLLCNMHVKMFPFNIKRNLQCMSNFKKNNTKMICFADILYTLHLYSVNAVKKLSVFIRCGIFVSRYHKILICTLLWTSRQPVQMLIFKKKDKFLYKLCVIFLLLSHCIRHFHPHTWWPLASERIQKDGATEAVFLRGATKLRKR